MAAFRADIAQEIAPGYGHLSRDEVIKWHDGWSAALETQSGEVVQNALNTQGSEDKQRRYRLHRPHGSILVTAYNGPLHVHGPIKTRTTRTWCRTQSNIAGNLGNWYWSRSAATSVKGGGLRRNCRLWRSSLGGRGMPSAVKTAALASCRMLQTLSSELNLVYMKNDKTRCWRLLLYDHVID